MPAPGGAFSPSAKRGASSFARCRRRFIEDLPGADLTKNLARAARRHFFDALVTRPAVALNPFASVRGRKYVVVDGKTPELTIQQARALLGSLDRSTVVGLRASGTTSIAAYWCRSR